MNIINMQEDIHQNALCHGWYDDGPRNFYDILGLIHSEWSEALEEVRTGTIKTYYKRHEYGDKPCGYWVELADGIIRLYDISEHWGIVAKDINFDNVLRGRLDSFSLSQFVGYLHKLTDEFLSTKKLFFPDVIISNIFYYAHIHRVDMLGIIMEKHEFNKKRPYKHGGKTL